MAEINQGRPVVVEAITEKARWEMRKLRLDVLLGSLAIGFAFAFSSGAALLFIYFLRHGFYPGGISASDTVSLSFLPVGFLLITMLGLAFMTVAAFPISRSGHWLLVFIQEQRNYSRMKRRGYTPAGELQLLIGMPTKQIWSRNVKMYFWVGVALLCVLIPGYIVADAPLRTFMELMFPAGLWLSMFAFGTQVDTYSVWPKSTQPLVFFDAWILRRSKVFRKALIASIVTLAIVALRMPLIQDASMLAMGYRKHDVSVRFTKEDFITVAERATRAGYALNACQTMNGAMPIIDHVDVLWHALGTSALLRYPALPLIAPPSVERAAIEFEPLNTSLTILRGR